MKRKLKLIYILHDIQIGGVEVALLSAIPLLSEVYELTIIVLGGIDKKLLNPLNEELRSIFKSFDYPLYTYPVKVRKIVRYVANLSPDLLVCSLWRASWIGTLVKRRVSNLRFFLFIHSSRFFHQADAYFSRRAVSVADVILVDSFSALQFVKRVAVRQVPIRRVSFLTHATPLENPLMHKRLFEDGEIRCLFMGSISKVKNLTFVVSFINDLRKRSFGAKLDLYGRKGDDFVNVERQIKALHLEDSVTYMGEVDPIVRMSVYRQYDFYIQQSEFEGMAMSVAEAMQNGLVCIASPVGEIPAYSRDGESVIFMEYKEECSRLHGLNMVSRMLNDPALYVSMSNRCHDNFLYKETYGESLLKNLI